MTDKSDKITRRTFVAGGIAAGFGVNKLINQESKKMSKNEKLIRDFIKAWSRLDAAELAAYFAEDGCYFNIPTQPVCGRANIEKMIRGFIATWTETVWEVKTLIAAGNVVIAERLDKTKTTKGNVDLPCVGVFELRDGKIKEWRDYFDLATYRNAMKG
jgi:limonene-1,2-epoxide hydrolase